MIEKRNTIDPVSIKIETSSPLNSDQAPGKQPLTNKARRAARRKARAPKQESQHTAPELLSEFAQLPIDQMLDKAWASRPREYIDEETTPEEQIAMQTAFVLTHEERTALGINFVVLGRRDAHGSLSPESDTAEYEVHMFFPRGDYTGQMMASRQYLASDVITNTPATAQSLAFWDETVNKPEWVWDAGADWSYNSYLKEIQAIDTLLAESPANAATLHERRWHILAESVKQSELFTVALQEPVDAETESAVCSEFVSPSLSLYPVYDHAQSSYIIAVLRGEDAESIAQQRVRGNTPAVTTVDTEQLLALLPNDKTGDIRTICETLGIIARPKAVVFQAAEDATEELPSVVTRAARKRAKKGPAKPRKEVSTRYAIPQDVVSSFAVPLEEDNISGVEQEVASATVESQATSEGVAPSVEKTSRRRSKTGATGRSQRSVSLAELAAKFGVEAPISEERIPEVRSAMAEKPASIFMRSTNEKLPKNLNVAKIVTEIRQMPHDLLRLAPSSWGEPDVIVRPTPIELPSEISPLVATLQEAHMFIEDHTVEMPESKTRIKQVLSSAIRNALALPRAEREAQHVYAVLTGSAPAAEFSSYGINLVFPNGNKWETLATTRHYLAQDPSSNRASVEQLQEIDQLVQAAQLEKWKETKTQAFMRHIDEIAALGRIIVALHEFGQKDTISDLSTMRLYLIASCFDSARSLQREDPSIGKLFTRTEYNMAKIKLVHEENNAAHFLQQSKQSSLIAFSEYHFSINSKRLKRLQEAYLAGDTSEEPKAAVAIMSMLSSQD